MSLKGWRVVGWPFSESALVPSLLVVGVGVSNAITGECFVTKSYRIAHFYLACPLRSDSGIRFLTLRCAQV